MKSESNKASVRCCFDGCPWRLYASIHSGSKKLRIKTLIEEHTCIDTEKNKLFNIPRLVQSFIDIMRENPTLKPVDMRSQVMLDYNVRVSLPQCKAARQKCLQILKSENAEQFERLLDYVAELKRSNHGSTIELETDVAVFSKMYIMFGALKEGWKSCRSIIHLDGAFFKGQFKGELLSTVSRDANDQVYPIAWAIVDVENKRNWSWFIKNLKDDLNLSIGEGITIMSDQQKGIILSVSKILPIAEHRMCARHIWANLKKKCNDDDVRMCLWRAAKSYTEAQFWLNMEALKQVSVIAYNELQKHDPRHWSRAFFSVFCKCDSVDNNFNESFNASVREARKQPVVQMLETIRKNVMASNGKKIALINGHTNIITPKAQELVDAQKRIVNACKVLNNGQWVFEVSHKRCSYVVNLDYGSSCSCKYKNLSGISCGHLIAAYWDNTRGHMKPEEMQTLYARWT